MPPFLKKRGKGEGREGGGEKGKKKGGEKKRYLENFDPPPQWGAKFPPPSFVQFGTIKKKHPFIKNNTPSDEVTWSLHSIAKERHIMLVNLLEMSQEEFENSECSREKWTIAEALGVSSSNLPTKGTNEYNTFVRVRELVRSKLDLGGKNLWLNILWG